jgi:electron transport complex protein RnfE
MSDAANTVSSWARARRTVWDENPAWVQLLGLCPLLAVSTSTVNALGLAIATLFVLTGSNVSIAAIRAFIPTEARLPAFMLVIASFTTISLLLMQAFAFEAYSRVALFVQIIVTNCIILARAERQASRQPISAALLDGLAAGVGFAVALLLLGMTRELIGHGTLFANMETLLGPAARSWRLDLADSGLLLASLPPGAFIIAGLWLAIWNGHRLKRSKREQDQA